MRFPLYSSDAYSREFELEADDYAFEMLSDAGLSPDLLGDALRRLSEEHGGDAGLKYFSSHPPFEDRIRRAEEASRRLEGYINEYRLNNGFTL